MAIAASRAWSACAHAALDCSNGVWIASITGTDAVRGKRRMLLSRIEASEASLFNWTALMRRMPWRCASIVKAAARFSLR